MRKYISQSRCLVLLLLFSSTLLLTPSVSSAEDLVVRIRAVGKCRENFRSFKFIDDFCGSESDKKYSLEAKKGKKGIGRSKRCTFKVQVIDRDEERVDFSDVSVQLVRHYTAGSADLFIVDEVVQVFSPNERGKKKLKLGLNSVNHWGYSLNVLDSENQAANTLSSSAIYASKNAALECLFEPDTSSSE